MKGRTKANDMAAMRKTLEEMAADLEDLASRDAIRAPAYSSIFSIYAEKCRKALAAPPRNCDRYATVDEAMDDFADEALIEEWNALKAGKDRDMLAVELFVFTKWLFATATEQEGGDK